METEGRVTCDHCQCVPELEARIEVLLDQLHDAVCQVREANRALQAYQQHPSTGHSDEELAATFIADWFINPDDCNPRGMKRPKRTVVR